MMSVFDPSMRARTAHRGETTNTGRFTVSAGATSFSLRDMRIRAGRTILLSPLDAASAALQWWIEYIENNVATVHFLQAASAACVFAYAVTGQNNADYQQE
jgi:hypothetical protein